MIRAFSFHSHHHHGSEVSFCPAASGTRRGASVLVLGIFGLVILLTSGSIHSFTGVGTNDNLFLPRFGSTARTRTFCTTNINDYQESDTGIAFRLEGLDTVHLFVILCVSAIDHGHSLFGRCTFLDTRVVSGSGVGDRIGRSHGSSQHESSRTPCQFLWW